MKQRETAEEPAVCVEDDAIGRCLKINHNRQKYVNKKKINLMGTCARDQFEDISCRRGKKAPTTSLLL